MVLGVARQGPGIVLRVVPRPRAARDVARAVRLARDLHPEVGVEQGDAGVRRRAEAEAGAGRVAPVVAGEAGGHVCRLVVGRGGILGAVERTTAVTAGVEDEPNGGRGRPQHACVAQIDGGGVEGLRGAGVAPLAVGVEGDSVPFAEELRVERRQRAAVPVLVRAGPEVARRDGGGVRQTLRDPGAVLGEVPRDLVVRDVEEESLRARNARARQPIRGLTDVQPAAVGTIEVHERFGRGRRELVDRIVELRVAGGGVRARCVDRVARRIGDRRLARVVGWSGGAERQVPRNEPQAVGLEDDDRLPVADAGGEAIDPGLVGGRVERAARRVLRAIPERNVVRHEHRHRVGQGRLGHRLVDVRLDLGRGTAGEPGRLRDRRHGGQPERARQIACLELAGDLLDRRRIGDVRREPRVRCQRVRGRRLRARRRDRRRSDDLRRSRGRILGASEPDRCAPQNGCPEPSLLSHRFPLVCRVE